MVHVGLMRRLQDSRDALLDAALREFGAHGYADASLEIILDTVGISQRVFRGHFNDKADLALAVLERESIRQTKKLNGLRAATTQEEFWSALRAGTVTVPHKQHVSGAPADVTRLAISARRHPEVAARLGAYHERWRERFESMLRRGQELRAVRSDLPMGVLLTIAHGLKGAAMEAHLPVERIASDGEIALFSQSFYSVLRRTLELRR